MTRNPFSILKPNGAVRVDSYVGKYCVGRLPKIAVDSDLKCRGHVLLLFEWTNYSIVLRADAMSVSTNEITSIALRISLWLIPSVVESVLTQSRFAGQGECRGRDVSRRARPFLRPARFNAKATQRSWNVKPIQVFAYLCISPLCTIGVEADNIASSIKYCESQRSTKPLRSLRSLRLRITIFRHRIYRCIPYGRVRVLTHRILGGWGQPPSQV